MRAARLMNTLLLLETRERVTARELAAAFEVSVRTVHRDIEALSSAGIPVYAERGARGGFRLIEGRSFQITGMILEEAAALPLAGMPSVAAELGMAEAATGAALKVLAALSPELRAYASELGQHVHVDLDSSEGREVPTQLLRGLLDAIRRRRVLSVRSVGRDGSRSLVEAEPLGLVRREGAWHLVARVKGRVTVLDLDAIEIARATGAFFERPASFVLRDWWTRRLRGSASGEEP